MHLSKPFHKIKSFLISFTFRLYSQKHPFCFYYCCYSNFMKLLTMLLASVEHALLEPSALHAASKAEIVSMKSSQYTGYTA